MFDKKELLYRVWFARVEISNKVKRFLLDKYTEEEIFKFDVDELSEKGLTDNQVLKILDDYNIKATFFVLGSRVELYPEIVKEIDAPIGDCDGPLQILFTNIEYDDYIGRIGVGRVLRGTVKVGQTVALCHKDGTNSRVKIAKLFMYKGLKRTEVETATVGDIIQVAGISELEIGESA